MGDNPSFFRGPDHPVEKVPWEDVQEFIRRLNQKEGHQRYRLPTEAEWEYSARAGSATALNFSGDVTELDRYAWYKANSGNSTHPAGKKKPNAWGLYDMYGRMILSKTAARLPGTVQRP